MHLYAVVVNGFYPRQVVVVWDRQESAMELSRHLNETIAPKTRVEVVDSFFPSGMREADKVWTVAADNYLQSNHIQGDAI